MINVIDDSSDSEHVIDKVDQLKVVEASCVRLPSDLGFQMAMSSLKKPKEPIVVGPGECTNGVNGILTLLLQSGVKQLAYSRSLFKLWLVQNRGAGGVPHPAPADEVDISKVPSPGEPNAPVPMCWGGRSQNVESGVDKFVATVPAYWRRSCVQL